MNDSNDPTEIVKSMKALNKFLQKENSMRSNPYPPKDDSLPKLNLDFSDTDSFNLSDCEPTSGSIFMKKHRDNIAGLDIVKKIREKDSEIVEGQTTISVLQSKLHHLQATFKKTKIQHDSEIDSYRKKQMRDKELVKELKHMVQQLESREHEIKDEMDRIKKQCESTSSNIEKKMLHQQTSHLEKVDQMNKELCQLRERVTYLEKDSSEKSSSLILHELQKKDLDEQISMMRQRLSKANEMETEMERLRFKLTEMKAKNQELELRLENLHEQEAKGQLFEHTMRQLPALQSELQKLKEENNSHRLTRINIGLLEERLAAAESQLKSYESRCNDLTAENATLVSQRELSEQYEEALRKELELEYLPPVCDVVSILQGLKKKDEDVTHSLTELKASLESHSSSKNMQEELVKSLKEDVEKGRLDLAKNSQIIRRLQRKVFLLSKERDNLTGILASYEAEATLNPSAMELERIGHLESQLESYKAEVAKLEEELSEVQEVQKYKPKSVSQEEKSGEMDKMKDRVQLLEKRVEELKGENETLQTQLEHHGLKGGFDPAKTKVLHFIDNPLEKAYQDRKGELDRLTEENDALKKRVQLLEEGETHDLTQKVGLKVDTEGVNSKQVQELEEKLNSLETRNKRLIDAFKLKSQEMREVVYRLTGYRVDLRGDNHYRLINMYSESQEDYLLFEQTAESELQLMHTEYSETLEDLIDSYLRQDHSFPAFLSALTLSLFSKQTMMNPSSSEPEEEELEPGDEDEEVEEDEMGEEEDENEEMGEGEDEEELEEEGECEEEEEEEDEEDEEEDQAPPAKRPRNEEEDDEDELICLD